MSHHDIAHLHPSTNVLQSFNFLHLTFSEIQPKQDFNGQGHYGNVKSRLYHDIAHLDPQPMHLPSFNFLHLTISEIQPGKTSSYQAPSHPDSMCENNTVEYIRTKQNH